MALRDQSGIFSREVSSQPVRINISTCLKPARYALISLVNLPMAVSARSISVILSAFFAYNFFLICSNTLICGLIISAINQIIYFI